MCITQKSQQWIALKRTAIAGIFIGGSRYPRYHEKTLKYAAEDVINILQIILQSEAAIQLLASKE